MFSNFSNGKGIIDLRASGKPEADYLNVYYAVKERLLSNSIYLCKPIGFKIEDGMPAGEVGITKKIRGSKSVTYSDLIYNIMPSITIDRDPNTAMLRNSVGAIVKDRLFKVKWASVKKCDKLLVRDLQYSDINGQLLNVRPLRPNKVLIDNATENLVAVEMLVYFNKGTYSTAENTAFLRRNSIRDYRAVESNCVIDGLRVKPYLTEGVIELDYDRDIDDEVLLNIIKEGVADIV